MKNVWKKAAAFIVSATFVTITLPTNVGGLLNDSSAVIVANAATGQWKSGNCSVVLTNDGTLTISKKSGNGAMNDYDSKNDPGWHSSSYSRYITKIVINDGVTYIGKYAFNELYNSTTVTIPNSVTSVGQNAFKGCTKLQSITIPDSVAEIADNAFSDCSSLETVNFISRTTDLSIGDSAFSGNNNLTFITPEVLKYTSDFITESSPLTIDILKAGKITLKANIITYTKHEAVPPTCTTNGTIEYWEGSDGNNYTYDGSAYTQIESIVDPATGIHTYNSASPVWTWIKTSEGYDVSVKFKCSNCKAVEIPKSQPIVVYDAENGIYTASVTFEDHEYTDTQAETKCNITINGTEKQYTYGQKIKAVASAPVEGQCFDGWYEGDTKLSGSETYYFYATRDINIHAVYAESVSESAPFYNYNVSPRQKLANGKQKVAFTVDWEFPEGYTLIEAGLVRSYTNINPISGGEDVTVKTSSLKGIRGTYVYNLTLGTANAEKTIYSKGYIKYRDSGNNEHTEYTELNTSSKA